LQWQLVGHWAWKVQRRYKFTVAYWSCVAAKCIINVYSLMPETPEAKCLQPLSRFAREPNSHCLYDPIKTHMTKYSSALRMSSHAKPRALLLGAC
jgi:hypothetical protein